MQSPKAKQNNVFSVTVKSPKLHFYGPSTAAREHFPHALATVIIFMAKYFLTVAVFSISPQIIWNRGLSTSENINFLFVFAKREF